jgi:hypothetical protein
VDTDSNNTEPVELVRRFDLDERDEAAWRASGLGPDEFEDWLTDRVARRQVSVRG